MARKRAIADCDLMLLFERYLEDVCSNDAKKFKIPQFGKYLRDNGYPHVSDTTLRRNNKFRKVIDSRKELSQQEHYQTIIAHKSLDVESFMMTNRTPQAIKKALVELNQYYKRVIEAALGFKKEADRYRDLQEKFEKQLDTLNKTDEELKNQFQRSKALEIENKKLKELIKTTVYPEIANELLKAEGLLKSENQIIRDDYLSTSIITADSHIDFNADTNIISNDYQNSPEKSNRVIDIKNLLDKKTRY